ncbi:MAG: ADP-forming succinate--CoA ligase subunit beta [Rhizomicrobium sp.]
MNIHEYQAKEVLRGFGTPVPRGKPAFRSRTRSPPPRSWADGLGGEGADPCRRARQGRRRQGGEVHRGRGERSQAHARHDAGDAPDGAAWPGREAAHIEDGSAIDRELYLSALVDRATSRVAFIASTEGGMDIEEVAHKTPEKIKTFQIEPAVGYSPYVGLEIATALKLKGDAAKQVGGVIKSLYDAVIAKDMSLLEINPLVLTKTGQVICLDAKINFDDNALYRHKDIQALRDLDEEDPMEVEASKFDLSYIKLDGEIGCMVNGAGLAMATMDIIKLYGSEPANFLDVGGGASKEKVTAAFKIIVSDPNVKGILVNIFGGIMKCDIIAEGIIAAAKEVSLKVPLVVRLEGTNVELGKKILAESGLPIVSANDLADAAQKIVKAVKGSK